VLSQLHQFEDSPHLHLNLSQAHSQMQIDPIFAQRTIILPSTCSTLIQTFGGNII
jgi:hypothetical protein